MTTDKIIEKLQPGDILLVSNKWKSWRDLSCYAIRFGNFFKKGFKLRHWTHAAMYLGDKTVKEAFQSGITRNNIQSSYLERDDFKLKIVRLKNRTTEELKQAAYFCAKIEDGTPYDEKALIYFVLASMIPPAFSFILEDYISGDLLNATNSYFCSELVAQGFLNAKIYTFENEPYRIMPVDFDNDILFETIHEMEIRKPWRIAKAPDGIKRIGYFLVSIVWFLFLIFIPILIFLIFSWIKSHSKYRPVKQ